MGLDFEEDRYFLARLLARLSLCLNSSVCVGGGGLPSLSLLHLSVYPFPLVTILGR